jgi:hypothetical protein
MGQMREKRDSSSSAAGLTPPGTPGATLPPLAVVGLSFRFPEEAVTADGFWNLLLSGRCVSRETPADRFNSQAHHNADKDRLETLSYKGGHFMSEAIDVFDAPFFSIGAAEAQAMDPIHRMVLETAYRALENAGLGMDAVSGSRTAVFSGCSSPDYATMLHKDPYPPTKYHATGTSNNMHANRLSWFFNLSGPSASVDTACSSSLMAMDLTCQAIWAGDADMVRLFFFFPCFPFTECRLTWENYRVSRAAPTSSSRQSRACGLITWACCPRTAGASRSTIAPTVSRAARASASSSSSR